MRLHGVVVLLLGVAACSVLNRDGPDVTCADLGGGSKNACADGIVATCSGGTVRWRVCDDKSACEQRWQVAGLFRCSESDPVPELSAGSGGSGGSGASGGSGGSAGMAPAVAVCGTCPTGYSEAANACNKECGDCGCFQRLCVSAGQTAAGFSVVQDACSSGEHAILSVPDCPAGCTNCGERLLCVPN